MRSENRAGEKPFWASDPLLKTFLLIFNIFSQDSSCKLLSIGAKNTKLCESQTPKCSSILSFIKIGSEEIFLDKTDLPNLVHTIGRLYVNCTIAYLVTHQAAAYERLDQLGMITTVHANIKVRNIVLQITAQDIALHDRT